LKKNSTSINLNKSKALKLIILFGIISLLGDIIYEGARSVNGPYLEILGANAAIIGFVAGVGEFLGYGIRLFSGYFSDKTKAYWFFVIVGYGLLFTVPLLALAGVWQLAALFIISERIGKALRNPAKDTILSQATKQVGTGMGFAIIEVFDQIGAVIGPLIFSVFFFLVGASGKAFSDYQIGYSFLWVPFILLMIVVVVAYLLVKKPQELEPSMVTKKEHEQFSRVFWLYTLFSFVTTFGFVNFALIGYHLKVHNILSDAHIPLLYAIAMGIDAVMALVIGKTYDTLKKKRKNDNAGLFALLIIPLLSMFIPLLAFSMNYEFIIISMVLWGMVMGAHETIMKSAIADITPLKKRGTGYGIFSTSYGLAIFGGSVMVGLLYDFSLPLLFVITIAVEIIAILFFYIMWKNSIHG
jgi:MFS family permease